MKYIIYSDRDDRKVGEYSTLEEAEKDKAQIIEDEIENGDYVEGSYYIREIFDDTIYSSGVSCPDNGMGPYRIEVKREGHCFWQRHVWYRNQEEEKESWIPSLRSIYESVKKESA